MAKVSVPIARSNKVAQVENGATVGATIGLNLKRADGSLVTEADLAGSAASPEDDGNGGNSFLLWEFLREVPANVTALQHASGTGLFAVTGAGTGALRTLAVSPDLTLSNPAGLTGNPTFGLADLADSGSGAALVKLTRDSKGRIAGTSAATTSDLAEGANLYYTDARADARITAQKGLANGLAPLGSDGKLSTDYLPAAVLGQVSYQGTWDASAGTPPTATPEKGWYFIVTVAGGTDLDGITDWKVGDWAIYNGASWDKVDNTDAVVTVNGYTGAVTLTAADVGAATAAQGAKADTALQEIVPGAGVSVDNTDPQRPIVSATGGGAGAPNNDVQQVLRTIRDGGTVKIVCLGDSITWGYHPDGTQATTPYPARLQALLREYYANSNVTVVNAGVPGDTTAAMIARYATDVAAQNPDLIVFNGGTNDAREASSVSLATYLANVLQILTLAGSTPVVIMGITPRFKEQHSDDGEGVIDFYRQTLRKVAAHYGLPYVDTFARFHALYKSRAYPRGIFSTDGSHYTDDGYLALGDIVFTDGFANENLTIKPGQFKDMGGQWIVSTAAATSWGGTDDPDGKVLVFAGSAAVKLYLYLEEWQNAALVLHACIDNTNATGQAITVQNQSISGAAARTFNLSHKTNGGVTSGFVSDYPIPAVKLKPGLNVVTLTAAANGARLTGLSALAVGDTAYLGVFTPLSHGGSGEWFWGTNYNQSTQAYSLLNPGAPVVIGNNADYVQPYFAMLPDYDGNSTRWRCRVCVSPSSQLYFGQQQNTTNGVSYVYRLTFNGTTAKVEIRNHDGTLQTCANTTFAVASTGQDVKLDFATSPTGWSLWADGTLIYSDTIPLSACHVHAHTSSTTQRTYLNPAIKKGPNASDTGALIGEQWISFVDGKLHFVTTAGTDKSVTFA